MPAEVRQTAVLLELDGQAADVPVQFSAMSQTPPAARQVVDEGTKELLGQAVDVPLQTSAESHTPAGARQVVVESSSPSDGQTDDVPVQLSTASHTAAAARHGTDVAAKVSAGQLADVPLQTSAVSQRPTDPRQVNEEVWKVQACVPLPLSLQQSAVLAAPLVSHSSTGQPEPTPAAEQQLSGLLLPRHAAPPLGSVFRVPLGALPKHVANAGCAYSSAPATSADRTIREDFGILFPPRAMTPPGRVSMSEGRSSQFSPRQWQGPPRDHPRPGS